MNRFLRLGASLYIPAVRDDLAVIANHRKYPFLRSVIFCTEDAVRSDDLYHALGNIKTLLTQLEPSELLRFVRVRNPLVLHALLEMDGVERLTGFVLPKVTRHNLEQYLPAFKSSHFFEVMPTLETIEVFDPQEMVGLRQMLLQPTYRERVLSLRIGGNDLFNLMGMRRSARANNLSNAAGVCHLSGGDDLFPYGFNVTGPVFEYLDQNEVLSREVKNDLTQGIFGKTAIHPRQVAWIERHYRVRANDLQMAERILDETAPAVFRLCDAMCEPATHRRWAVQILERARLYGIARSVKAF